MIDTSQALDYYKNPTDTSATYVPAYSGSSYGGGTNPADWMDNTYYRNWYSGSPDYDPNEVAGANAANQGWWRSPNDAGGLLYNDYYGWQLADQVKQKYNSAAGPVSNSDFTSQNWFNPQTSQDWSQYYPDRHSDAWYAQNGYSWMGDQQGWVQDGGSSGGGGTGSIMDIGGVTNDPRQGGTPTGDGSGGTTATGSDAPLDDPTSGITGGDVGTSDSGAFNNYPDQWGTASDILNYFGTGGATDIPQSWLQAQDSYGQMANNGMPVSTPDAWTQALGTYGNIANNGLLTATPDAWTQAQNAYSGMAANGNPTDASAAYEAAKQKAYYDVDAAIKQSNEQSGLAGKRWSTPLGAQNANIAAKTYADLGSQFAQQQMTAQEAAQARILQAAQGLYTTGQGEAGLSEAAANRQLSGAQGLYDVGQGQVGIDEAAASRMLSGAQGLYTTGQGETGLTEAAKNRAMDSASGLSSLGAQYAQLPMTAATTSMDLGTQMQTTGQSTLDKVFTEYMRNAGENNPYLAMIYQMATGQGMPQQYTQGTGSQLLGSLSGLGSLAAKM